MCDFIKSFADHNQGTLHLVTRCFREMYDRNEFCAVLLFFNYTLPSFEDDNSDKLSICTMLIRQVPLSSNPVTSFGYFDL